MEEKLLEERIKEMFKDVPEGAVTTGTIEGNTVTSSRIRSTK